MFSENGIIQGNAHRVVYRHKYRHDGAPRGRFNFISARAERPSWLAREQTCLFLPRDDTVEDYTLLPAECAIWVQSCFSLHREDELNLES